jgi:hypothetical protein
MQETMNTALVSRFDFGGGWGPRIMIARMRAADTWRKSYILKLYMTWDQSSESPDTSPSNDRPTDEQIPRLYSQLLYDGDDDDVSIRRKNVPIRC